MTEGEFWTSEVLAELRAAGYRPRAWASFLGRSRARARLTRSERRRAHRQTLALGALGFAFWLAFALVGQSWLALAGAVWWALIVLMLDWHLGMLEDTAGRRSAGLGAANLLTLLRAATVPALPVLPATLLLAVLLPSGITDALDGMIARARGAETRLGVWLDGGVDGFVLGAAAVGAGRGGLLPWWTVALVLARHALQWTVVAVAFFVAGELSARAGLVSGRVPGVILFAGLVLACLRLPGASTLVAAGSLGGLTTLALTLARPQMRLPVAILPAGSGRSRLGR